MRESQTELKETERRFTREVLSTVVRKVDEVQELLPTRLPNGGFIYKEIDDLNLCEDSQVLLNHMFEQGYLEKRPSETMLVCPVCHEGNVVPILKCKSCGALAIKRERLIEHKAGGHIHPESSFKIQEDKIVCPSCSRSLNSTEWRTLGAWFVCAECGERQAQMAAEFKCLKDNNLFTPVLGEFVMLYKYTVTEKARSLLGFDETSIAEGIVKVLSKEGAVDRNFAIKGKSGVEHVFDIAVKTSGKHLLIDVAFSNQPIGDAVVLASFAKTFEVKGEDYLLIIWPELSKSAQNLVDFYKINIIQGTNLESMTKELEKYVEEHK
ncbi:MAG: hypothetical protein M1503_04580 [Thaumarchaeota archaeon]|nr:hypothetical protein [Nitrososphaerota archaeon]